MAFCKRAHFVWSGALTILFCMVCDVPAILLFYSKAFIPNILTLLTTSVLSKIIQVATEYLFILLSKMSWYKISMIITSTRNTKSRSASVNKRLASSRNSLLRISIMSCTCLLMNTASTLSVSAVLGEWSLSSNRWLTCTVAEEVFTRNWSNYGMHVGTRFSPFVI